MADAKMYWRCECENADGRDEETSEGAAITRAQSEQGEVACGTGPCDGKERVL